MSTWAKPGVRCVCIDSGHAWDRSVSIWARLLYWRSGGPALNEICKINLVVRQDCDIWLGFVGYYCIYEISGFRPLVTLDKTVEADTELFLKIAHQAPALNEADA